MDAIPVRRCSSRKHHPLERDRSGPTDSAVHRFNEVCRINHPVEVPRVRRLPSADLSRDPVASATHRSTCHSRVGESCTLHCMSCIRFNTTAQRQALREAAPSMLTAEEAAALHPAPPVTASKITRLRLLAKHTNPKIRESVASNQHTPEDVYLALAHDSDTGVRSCLARNEAVPCDILRFLAQDQSEHVRGWLAVNFFAPVDVMELLADDPDETVRGLVSWKSELARMADSGASVPA
jgi:hypothetical protein